MMAHPLRLATRASALALVQTEIAKQALGIAVGDRPIEVVEVSTRGDRDRTTPLTVVDGFGGQGVFVGALREALLNGRAEIAVHSLKDVPTTPVEGLTIAAVLERGDPCDMLVSRERLTLAALPAGARVGTSATRRAAMVRALRPDIEAVSIRGNVDTRLQKVAAGEYDAAILAAAGLDRLGRLAEAVERFDPSDLPPAPAQGVIALECCNDDAQTMALLTSIDHEPTRAAVEAERAFIGALGAGCALPIGAYATIAGDSLTLRATLSGDPSEVRTTTGPIAEARDLGRSLAEEMLAERGDTPVVTT